MPLTQIIEKTRRIVELERGTMLKTQVFSESLPLVLYMSPVIDMTDDQFFEFCQINRDLRIERTAKGDLIIMTPAGGETSWRNSELVTALNIWAKQDGTGVVFDSSGGFILPNGATRAPDATWVKRSRLAVLTPAEKKKFLPLCPDFAIELRSPTDRLEDLQAKMQEYVDNGLKLGWLIDPEEKRVYVYMPHSQVECLKNPSEISGDPILLGFALDLEQIWRSGF
jgi:Uma2 family endonuclease